MATCLARKKKRKSKYALHGTSASEDVYMPFGHLAVGQKLSTAPTKIRKKRWTQGKDAVVTPTTIREQTMIQKCPPIFANSISFQLGVNYDGEAGL